MTGQQRVSRAFVWASLESFGMSGLSMISLIVLARIVGPDAFGVVALAYTVVQILILLLMAAFHDAIVQHKELSDRHADTGFWTSVAVGTALTAGCWAFAPSFGAVYGEPEVVPVLQWLSLSILLTAVSVPLVAQMRRDMDFRSVAVRSLVGRLAGIAVALALAFAGYGVWALVAQQLGGGLVATLAVLVSVKRRPRLDWSFGCARDLMRYGVHSLLGQALWTSQERILSLFVGYFLGTTALGYLNLAIRLVSSVQDILASALGNVSFAMLSRRQDDAAAMRESCIRGTELVCLLTMPLFAGLLVCADPVIRLLLGGQWLPAVPLVQVLAVGAMLFFARMIAAICLNAAGKPHLNVQSSMLSFTTLIVMLALMGRTDVLWASFAWVSRFALALPFGFWLVQRHLGIDTATQIGNALRPIIAAVAMATALVTLEAYALTPLAPWLELVVMVPAGAVLYTLVLALLDPRLLRDAWGLLRLLKP